MNSWRNSSRLINLKCKWTLKASLYCVKANRKAASLPDEISGSLPYCSDFQFHDHFRSVWIGLEFKQSHLLIWDKCVLETNCAEDVTLTLSSEGVSLELHLYELSLCRKPTNWKFALMYPLYSTKSVWRILNQQCIIQYPCDQTIDFFSHSNYYPRELSVSVWNLNEPLIMHVWFRQIIKIIYLIRRETLNSVAGSLLVTNGFTLFLGRAARLGVT